MFARHRLLLPVTAVLFALSACGPMTDPVAGSTSAASAPTSAAPAAGSLGTSPAAATKSSGGTAGSAGCPSAKTLETLVDLPKGWSFPQSGVACVKDWASANPKRPTAGDGVYLFHYKSGTGWRYYDQGSGWDCKDLGLTVPAPFCISDPVATTKASTGGATSAKCPSAKTLETLVDLPKGWSFGSVQCVENWAGADPQGPTAGDGVYLFHYKAATGWRYYGEGSGYDCKDLGLKEPAPFCIS
jgi:hypothetical protein